MTRSISLLFCILIFIQCENLFLNENDNAIVTAIIEGDELVIRNGLHFDVYFFAVDLETSYLIDWIPTEREQNRIKANSTRVFSTDSIEGYKANEKVIVFLWGNNQEYWKTLELSP